VTSQWITLAILLGRPLALYQPPGIYLQALPILRNSPFPICKAPYLMMSSTISTTDDAPRDPPPTSPLVTYNGKNYKIASEGAAEILDLHRPEDAVSGTKGAIKPQSVFYNPIQQYNRDLSVLAIRAFVDDYVAVQKSRRQRRADQPVKSEQQGKKRKIGQAEGQDGGGGPESKKRKMGQAEGQDDGGGPESKKRKMGQAEGQDDGGGPESKKRKMGQAEGQDDGGGPESEKREVHKPVNGGSSGADIAPTVSTIGNGAGASRAEGVNPELNGQQDTSAIAGEDTAEQGKATSTNPKEAEGSNTPTKRIQFRILDALSATGLRALRYAKEIPTVTSVTANDLSASATASIKLNVSHNKLSDKIIPTTSDAIQHMHEANSHLTGTPGPYHVIDLDPYGTAAPFLDAAVQALADGGLLCVTCTDAGVFASIGYLEKTYSQYGGLPLKGAHAHEAGLRLILQAIATSAARYGLAIEPLLSLSIDFYARVFVRIHRSPAEVKFLASKTMIVYNCDSGCGAWSTQHLARAKAKTAKNGDTFYNFTSALAPSAGTHCEHCGFRTHQAGPMWGGPLHNLHFIQRILDMLPTLDEETYGTIPRMEGMLNIALNETLDDQPSGCSSPVVSSSDRPIPTTHPATLSHHPFFVLPSALSRVIHCVSPSDAAMRGALLHLGYRTTRSHTKAGSICTDAPWSVIWEIMREWVRQKSPIKEGAIKTKTAGWGIMQQDRSKRKLNEVKEAFTKDARNAKLDEVSALKTYLEAALYQLSKDEAEKDNASEAQEGESTTNGTKEREGESATETPQKDTHPSKLKIVFDEALGKESQGKRMVKYQINPRPDWGPMNRAKGRL